MDALARDVRHAVRVLVRDRTFTLLALVILALGIGANTAMFSIAYGLLLRPLPYPDAAAIVRVGHRNSPQPGSIGWLTNSTLPRLQEEAGSFEHVAGFTPRDVVWTSPDGPVTLRGAMVSPSLFPLLRATPHLGRLFIAEEAREGAHRVVLMSHRAWTTRFASDPDIADVPIELNGEPYTVAGVLAEGFAFPRPEVEMWTPMVIPSSAPVPDAEGRTLTISFAFAALGRLRPGVSPAQAAVEVDTLLRAPDDGEGPSGEGGPPRLRDFVTRVVPLQEEMMREHRPALLVLSAAAFLVLLIASVNVAGLLLARGITRQRELAVRGALGAGRGRIARQLLTESVVLGAGGGALGLMTAAAVLRAVPALAPPDLPRLHEVDVDGAVLAFSALLSVAVGLAVGAVPAFQWSRLPLVRILNEGNARAAGGFRLLRANRARAALAVTQIALAFVLLVGAGLLLRSFVQLVSVDPGYDAANVLTARVGNPDLDTLFLAGPMTLGTMAERRAVSRRFYAALVDRLAEMERLPAIEAVGVSSGLPFGGGGRGLARLRVAGRPEPADPADLPEVRVQTVSSGYFRTMRLRLLSGRVLTRLDAAGAPRVVVVNETLVRDHLDGAPAVGQRLLFGRDDEPWTVVGVVADVEYQDLAATGSTGEIYLSVFQSETASVLNLSDPFVSLRATADPVASLPFLRDAVADVHTRAPLDDVMTMDARLSTAVSQPRVYSLFVGSFAALALFVAGAGLYGLLSRTVSERRREIGVRMALGAQRYDVLALVVRQGAGLTAVGTVLGLFVSAASARLLESLLFGVAADDPRTFLAALLALASVALVACWLPGHRAARMNPMDALRAE